MDNLQIAASLRSLADQIAGSAQPAVPPGFVAVHPTGPKGAGKVRFWPEVTIVNGTGDINYLSYLNRMQRTPNTITNDGKMFCTPGNYGDAFSGKDQDMPYPDHADKHMYPFDWFTQEELDKIAELAARDAGASWGAGG